MNNLSTQILFRLDRLVVENQMTLERHNDRHLKGFAFAGFLTLYPLFFWYHVALSFGHIPNKIYFFTQGLYGPVSVIICVVYIVLVEGKKENAPGADCLIYKLFFIYLIWAIIWGSFNVAFQLYPYTHDGAVKLVKDLTLQLANFIVATLLVIRRDTSSTIVIFAAWISIVVLRFCCFRQAVHRFFIPFCNLMN